MSAALRLVDSGGTPTLSPTSLGTPRSSMCPTLVPRAHDSQRPSIPASPGTIPPMTQRSATLASLHPRGSAATQHEAYNLLAVMRMNVEFLVSVLESGADPAALEALDDLHRTIDRLERRCAGVLAASLAA